MNKNEEAKLIPIIEWIKTQKEWKCCEITNPRSIFYEVAPMTFAKLILRYSERQESIETSEQHDSKTLHIADVSDMLLAFIHYVYLQSN